MSRVTDADGVWEVRRHPSGATSRVLVEPSEEYLAARAAEHDAREARISARDSERSTALQAVHDATTVAELRSALAALGIIPPDPGGRE